MENWKLITRLCHGNKNAVVNPSLRVWFKYILLPVFGGIQPSAQP